MDRIGDKIRCNPSVKLQKGNLYSFIDMEKIKIGTKYITGFDYASYEGQSCSKFCSGDTIMARITPCLENGKIAQYKSDSEKAFGSTEFFVFRGIPNITDSNYVYYLMSTKYIRDLAINSMTGASGRQRADVKFIKKIKWKFPDLPTQQRIADILSTYDDLIENNNKRIALLEKAAQELYKEWFVRFRFPGHETTRFVNGLPEGWNRVKLSELIEFNPTIKNTGSTRYKIIPMVALSTSNMIIDETQIGISENLTGCRFNNGDTLLARITPCLENGKTGFVQCLDDFEVAGGSTEFIVMRSKKLNPYIVYFIARDQAFRDCAIASMNGADGRQRVKPDRLKKLQWLHPPMYIVDAFGEIVRPSFKLIRKLSLQNQNLAKQRDLLLPRLMSGKLEV